jgi:hypothetical protein
MKLTIEMSFSMTENGMKIGVKEKMKEETGTKKS